MHGTPNTPFCGSGRKPLVGMRNSVDAAAILRLRSRGRTRRTLRVMTSVVSLLLQVIMVVVVAADKPSWGISFVRHPDHAVSIPRRPCNYHCRRHIRFAAVLPDNTHHHRQRRSARALGESCAAMAPLQFITGSGIRHPPPPLIWMMTSTEEATTCPCSPTRILPTWH